MAAVCMYWGMLGYSVFPQDHRTYLCLIFQVDELLQWTTALNFDDYLEGWKESATSNISEFEVEEMIANKASKANSKFDVNYVSYSIFNEGSTENKDKTQNFNTIQVPQT